MQENNFQNVVKELPKKTNLFSKDLFQDDLSIILLNYYYLPADYNKQPNNHQDYMKILIEDLTVIFPYSLVFN
jgi:hypothetical protein